MSIGNLSSAPDQAGPRSEHDALMELHLSLPDHFARGAADPLAAGSSAVETALVESSGDGGDDDDSGGSAILSFLPLLLIVAAVYFFLLRPRQRQMRQQRDLQSSLAVGDEVMLTSGVYGFITGFETGSDVVWVEIDDDVQIRVSRAAVSGKVDTTATATATADAAEGTTEPTAGAPRRPTLKGGSGSKPPAGASPAPAPASGENTTDESTDE
jgi:preprotein translocase subunit YajC